jgi:hypothetical protein
MGDDFHSYPVRVTDYNTDTLITKGSSIWKEKNSKLFKIENGGRQIEYEQSDQWANMKIEIVVFMTIIFGWTIAVTFLVTIKLGEGNDAQQGLP